MQVNGTSEARFHSEDAYLQKEYELAVNGGKEKPPTNPLFVPGALSTGSDEILAQINQKNAENRAELAKKKPAMRTMGPDSKLVELARTESVAKQSVSVLQRLAKLFS